MSKRLSAGAALEKVIRDDLPVSVELDPREEVLVRAAAAQADDIAALEADVRARGRVNADGVLNPSVREARHGKAIMQDWPRHRPGFRPWAFSEWKVGEHPEDREAEVLLLAEHGLLFEEEIEALAAKRRYWHINEERWCTDPADGVITSWSFRAAASPPQLKFKVARAAPGQPNAFTIAGEGDLVTPTASTLNTYPAVRLAAGGPGERVCGDERGSRG